MGLRRSVALPFLRVGSPFLRVGSQLLRFAIQVLRVTSQFLRVTSQFLRVTIVPLLGDRVALQQFAESAEQILAVVRAC